MQGLTTAAFSWTQIVIEGRSNFTYFGRQLFIRENKQICRMKPKFGSDNLWALNTQQVGLITVWSAAVRDFVSVSRGGRFVPTDI